MVILPSPQELLVTVSALLFVVHPPTVSSFATLSYPGASKKQFTFIDTIKQLHRERRLTTITSSKAAVILSSATTSCSSSTTRLYGRREEYTKDDATDMESSSTSMTTPEYRNNVVEALALFMNKNDETKKSNNENKQNDDILANINFDAPKRTGLDLQTMAAVLDAELCEKEWFVTGNVNPIFFAESFRFQDPDVQLDGIEAYARGVNKLFNQNTSRAKIISTTVASSNPNNNDSASPNNVITCTWRLSGDCNIGPGLKIKPYIVYTDFTVDSATGLIVLQEDRFSIPQWDILLSSLFPFLIGKITAPPAPDVEPRVVKMPALSSQSRPFGGKESPLDFLTNLFQK